MSTLSGANLNKVYSDPRAALAGLSDGASLLIGGFAGHGEPEGLLEAVIGSGVRGLTVISQGAGAPDSGRADINLLVEEGVVQKLISPLPFDPRRGGPVRDKWQAGELELEVQPAGVLTERIRAGGAGIGGLFLPTGAGTRFAEGREVRQFNGRDHIFQPALKADFALLRATAADTLGNLTYTGTQRNWNPIMAMAARVTVVEVDEIREPGGLDPELVITPAIFVQRLVLSGPDS